MRLVCYDKSILQYNQLQYIIELILNYDIELSLLFTIIDLLIIRLGLIGYYNMDGLKDTNVGSYHNIILPDRRLADPKANWLEL